MKDILYLDMDEVLASFRGGIIKLCPDFNPDDFKIHSEKVNTICEANPYIFHDLEPIKDAVPCVKELFPIYDVYFLSTPMWNLPLSYTGKRIWLEKYFGKDAERRLILTHRKDLNVGRFLVDDSLHFGVSEFKGEHIHFGTNKFPDWITTRDYLKRQKEIRRGGFIQA